MRQQNLFGRCRSVLQALREPHEGFAPVRGVSVGAFARTELRLDAIFAICLYDAVPASARRPIADAAFRNLRAGGRYFVVAPRNDSTILRRFRSSNAYEDGHVFTRWGTSTTFFANFRHHDRLLACLRDAGFELVADRSCYRHVWLDLRKPARTAEGPGPKDLQVPDDRQPPGR